MSKVIAALASGGRASTGRGSMTEATGPIGKLGRFYIAMIGGPACFRQLVVHGAWSLFVVLGVSTSASGQTSVFLVNRWAGPPPATQQSGPGHYFNVYVESGQFPGTTSTASQESFVDDTRATFDLRTSGSGRNSGNIGSFISAQYWVGPSGAVASLSATLTATISPRPPGAYDNYYQFAAIDLRPWVGPDQ